MGHGLFRLLPGRMQDNAVCPATPGLPFSQRKRFEDAFKDHGRWRMHVVRQIRAMVCHRGASNAIMAAAWAARPQNRGNRLALQLVKGNVPKTVTGRYGRMDRLIPRNNGAVDHPKKRPIFIMRGRQRRKHETNFKKWR